MRYTNIQLLRLAAAVGVVLYHLGCHAPALAGADPAALRHPLLAGFPVPLFFAVSGFVLTGALRTAPPGRFLVARFLRLYPGYWLAVAVALALMAAGALTETHRRLPGLVGRDTLTLWPAGPGRVLYVLGVEWSLVYEVFLSAALAGLAVAGGVRRVPWLAAAWLAAIGVKAAVRPGWASDVLPHWTTIALSGMNVPFLLGVLAYPLRDRGRRLRWAVLAGVGGLLAAASAVPLSAEASWACWGAAAAGVVWLAVQLRQVGDRHPLARLGDCTYGLFLLHVPLMLAVLHPAARLGWGAVGLAGGAALAGGLLFGRVECGLHARLRPLAKVRLPNARRLRPAGLSRPSS